MNGLAFNALEKKHIPELAKMGAGTPAGLLIAAAKAKDLADKILTLA